MNFAKPFELLKLGQGRRRDAGEAIWGILADNPNVPGNSNKCMVRFPAGADENGVQQYYPPIAVRHGIGANFVKKGGRRVWVGMGYDGQPEIKQGDWQDLVQVGITPAKTNALSTEGKVANPANPFAPLLSEPVNTANTPGMLVTVYPLWYDTGAAIKYYPGTGSTASKVNLTSFVPVVGEWCYVVLWLDTDANALETPTASTPVALTSGSGAGLSNTAIIAALEECYAAKPNANCIPIKAFYLADAQTTLTQSTRHHDLRQMVNLPGGGDTLPVADTTAIVKGSSDATKLLRFEVDGFTTGTTRVLTPPNYDATIASLAGTETLTNKTLTVPTIADFTNAQHNHTNAAGGGLLPAAAIPGLPYKTGMPTLRRADNATLYISPGVVDVSGTRVEYTTTRVLGMATAADYIGGAVLEAASTYANVYSSTTDRLLYDALPNCPTPAAPVFTGQINGSPGLNGTSIVYDNDTGEGSITVGMLLGVYTNSGFTTGRGRGSGAGGHLNFASFALITAINTGTNTITVEAGHNINLTDNDYLIVVPFGPLIYRNISSTWYRFIGSMFNNASSNLESERLDTRALYTLAATYTNTTTTLANVDTTNLTMNIMSTGDDIRVLFGGTATNNTTGGGVRMDLLVDGVLWAGNTGVVVVSPAANQATAIVINELLYNLLPGTHTVIPQFSAGAGGTTASILAAGTSGGIGSDVSPQFIVERR